MSSGGIKKPFQKFQNNSHKKKFGNKLKKANYKNQRFFENAKSFARKGSFGRGTHLEQDDFSYFMGILDTQQTRNQTLNEKVAMANNVMEQTKSKEIHVSSNQVVSRVLENSLGFVDDEHLERFFEAFSEGLRPTCSDDHASHVLNKLLEIATLRALAPAVVGQEEGAKKGRYEVVTDLKYNLTHDFKEEHRENCNDFVLRITKFLMNNLEDFVDDKNANHLIRTAVLSLAGIHIPRNTLFKGKLINNTERFTGTKSAHRKGQLELFKTVFDVPRDWLEVMNEFADRLQMWPQFKDFPYKFRKSGLLQTICIALHQANHKAFEAMGKKLLDECFVDVDVPESPYDENDGRARRNHEDDNEQIEGQSFRKQEEESNDEDMPSVFKSDAAARLLQTLISLASPKLLAKIKTLFDGRILSAAFGKHSTYALERLINYSDKAMFEELFDELAPKLDELLQKNQFQIISALSGSCLRLKTKQAACITAFQNALHCSASHGSDNPKSMFACLSKLKPIEVLPYDQANYVTLFGALVIQDMLEFNKPIVLVNSILETPVKFLLQVLDSGNGSYIAETFLTSATIGEKSREKFMKMLEGFYLDLAVSKFGSRVVETIMKFASDGLKVVIAKELTGRDNKLKGSPFGRIVYNALRLETFKLSVEQWKATFNDKAKAEEAKPVKEEEDESAEENNDAEVEEEKTEKTTTSKLAKKNKNKKNKKRPAS